MSTFTSILDSTGATVQMATATITGGRLAQTQIYDGTNAATIKPASTAPVAGDPALVVALSPNSPTGTSSLTIQGAAAAASAAVGNPVQVGGVFNSAPTALTSGQQGQLQLDTNQNLLVKINGGVTGASALQFQGAAAQGATIAGNPVLMGATFTTSPATITSGQAATLQTDATQNLLVKINSSLTGSNSMTIQGTAASSAAAVGNPLLCGLQYNSSAPTPSSGNVVNFQGDSSGQLLCNVRGAAAQGAAIVGNPVLMGATFTTSPATITTGQAATLQTTNKQELLVSLSTGGTGGTIKAASTAPALTDTALVVAQSPNCAFSKPTASSPIRNLAGTVTAVKASAGVLYGLMVVNNTGATAWIQIFDVATGSVTLGTTSPDREFQVAANTTVWDTIPNGGIPFGTAISIASTTAEKGSSGSASGVHVFPVYA